MTVAMISATDLAIYPLLTMDRDMLSMMDLVYESLVVLDDSRNPSPGLATSWQMLGDGKTWIFTLREKVLFHNGNEMTAYDVAATMDAIKIIASDETLPANQKGMYVNVANICHSWKAEDAYTLTVTTNRPFYGLLYAMTFPILQAQSVMEQNPPGTGPYRVEYYAPGEELWLVGNQNWYNLPPYVNEIIGKWYPDVETALAAFEAEDVDIIMTRSTAAVRYRGTTSSRASSYDYATQQLECLMINYANHLKDLDMRKAVVHAINTSRLTSNVYQSMVTPTNTLQSPDSWLYKENVTTYAYNPEEANALLDSLGWGNINDAGYRFRKTDTGETKVLEFRIGYYNEAGNNLRGEAAEEIGRMLNAVGIKVRFTPYEFEAGAQKLTSADYDLFLCAYNMDVVPDPNYILLSNGYGNYAKYRSDDMNTLCQALRKAAKAEDFQSTWFEIQTLMANDLPFLPLYWREGVVLTRYPYSNIRDIRENELLRSINEYN